MIQTVSRTPTGGKHLLEGVDRENNPVSCRVDVHSPTSVAKAARTLSVGEGDVRTAVAGFEATQLGPGGEPPPKPIWVALCQIEDGTTVEVEGETPVAALLNTVKRPDCKYARWEGTDDLCALDVDVTAPFSEERLWEFAYRAGADASWLTRRGGMRLIFQRDTRCAADERAAAAAVLLEFAAYGDVEKVELLRNTRPPAQGRRILTGSGSDNSVGWLTAHVQGRALSPADQERVAIWLAGRGYELGKRVPHTRCLFNPSPTSGDDPVIPLPLGLYCHVCQNTSGSGFRSYAALLDDREDEPHPLLQAARERVPWAHQQRVMAADWSPKLPVRAAKLCYSALVKCLGGDADVLARVLDPDWVWLRTESGAWVHRLTFEPADVALALPSMSWTHGVPARVTQCKGTGPLVGIRPVRAVACILRPDAVDPTVALVARDDRIKPRRPDLLPWDETFAELAALLPGLSRTYLETLLLACVCAESGEQVIGVHAVGVTDSAKTATPMLAGEFMGCEAPQLRFDVDAEEWRRQIGHALLKGQRPLVVDEIDKVANLFSKRAMLHGFKVPHQFRPLYSTDMTVRWSAPLVLTGIQLHDVFLRPEVGRRYRLVRLLERVDAPAWRAAKLGTGAWRRDKRRALLADSALAWAMKRAAELGFDWPTCAESVGITRADYQDPEETASWLTFCQRFYEHVTSDGAALSVSRRYPSAAGWRDLNSVEAQSLLQDWLPQVQPGQDPRYNLSGDLKAVTWSSIVGRPVYLEIRTVQAVWVARFVHSTGT